MAWSNKRSWKKYPTRKTPYRRPSLARAVASKLPKRYQWVALHDDLCPVATLDYRVCCDEETDGEHPACEIDPATGNVVAAFPLAWYAEMVTPAADDNQFAARLYQKDTLTIVRMKGRIDFCPVLTQSTSTRALCTSSPDLCPVGITNDYSNANYIFRAALSKDKWTWNEQAGTYAPPERNPLATDEWTDGQFLKQWEKRYKHGFLGQHLDLGGNGSTGCYGNVAAAGAGAPANTLSSGSGTINIPAISTTAADCPANPGAFLSSTPGARHPGCFTLWFNMRRRLVFKENEGMAFWFNWTAHEPIGPAGSGIAATPPVTFKMQKSIKALLEVA